MSYILTETGEGKVKAFLDNLAAKRKEILDAGLDRADDPLPTEEDIISDINADNVTDYGSGPEYINGWGCTDNYDSDRPLSLMKGTDFIDTDAVPVLKDLKAALADMQHAFYTMLGIAEDNLPDCGDEEYVDECNEDYNNARDEFKAVYDKAIKFTA